MDPRYQTLDPVQIVKKNLHFLSVIECLLAKPGPKELLETVLCICKIEFFSDEDSHILH